MVDLAFLLLTFFVLTTSLNKSFVLPLTMPDESNTPAPPTPVPAKRVVTFILDDHDEVYWYQGLINPDINVTNFSKNGLRKILIDKKIQIEKLVVLVKASDKSKYRNVVDMLDELSITEIKQYSMVDITSEDKEMIKEYKLNRKH